MTLTTEYTGPLYGPASLETAACLWEAVLDFESNDTAPESLQSQIKAAREAIGSSGLRCHVIGWTQYVDADWHGVDTDGGKEPQGGQYGDPFDWEFVPDWIIQNIDWSDPHAPRRRTGSELAVRAMPANLHGWLIDDMAMRVEGGAGGAFNLRHEGPNGSFLRVSCGGGGDMPTRLDWHVTAYRDEADGEGMFTLTSDYDGKGGVTLRQAVAAAQGVLAEFAPVATAEEPADRASRIEAAATALVEAYGSNPPDWIAGEYDALTIALNAAE